VVEGEGRRSDGGEQQPDRPTDRTSARRVEGERRARGGSDRRRRLSKQGDLTVGIPVPSRNCQWRSEMALGPLRKQGALVAILLARDVVLLLRTYYTVHCTYRTRYLQLYNYIQLIRLYDDTAITDESSLLSYVCCMHVRGGMERQQ
jgi:hypothetical protein